jgi:uncharacterized FlgJ-related protein
MKKLLLILSLILISLSSQEQVSQQTFTLDELISEEPTLENIYKYALHIGVEQPQIFLAQVIEETGWLTSNVFKKSNNLCGMNYTRNRFAIGKYKCYAKYKSWKDSVKAYKLWQDKRYKGGNYLQFLTNLNYAKNNQQAQVYAENPNYIRNIKSILKILENEESTNHLIQS